MESYANRKVSIEADVTPPWYVSIWMTDGKEFSFNCGGTLVGNWILSSAHCFVPDVEYLNAHSIRTENFIELEPVLERLVLFGNQTIYDPNFDPSKLFKLETPMYIPLNYNFLTFQNDLVAIKIPKAVPRDYIVPLCFQSLPPNDQGEKCWISGPALTSVSYLDIRSEFYFIQNPISEKNAIGACSIRLGMASQLLRDSAISRVSY